MKPGDHSSYAARCSLWYERGLYRNETLAAALQRAVARRPDTPLHFHTELGLRRSTAREIWDTSGALCGALQASGLQAGDVFALSVPTSFECVTLYVAAFRAGATVLPLVHNLGAADVQTILEDARASWFASPASWYGQDLIERFAAVPAVAGVKGRIIIGEDAPAGARTWRDLLATHSAPPALVPQDADACCVLLYTSGTTARPKGVQHSHNTIRSEWEIPFLPNEGPYLNPFPAGHIAGFNFMLRPIVCGVPMVYLDRWDATVAAQLVERFRVTQSGGTPYFMHSLIDAAQRGGYDLSSIRAFSLGATGVTPELVRYADRFGWGAGRSYGLTEHSTVTRCDPGMPYEKRAYTDGRLQPGTEVRIVNLDGRDLGRGEQGEILTRGPELFMGYTDSRLDVDCFVDDGWFRTGDLGHIDADGYLTITDRLKDIVIRGGENISSREVEDVLVRHPQVQQVAVIGLPDERYGECVCAAVVPKEAALPTLDSLLRHCCEAGLASFKTPARLVVVPALPMTASGKVRKGQLREELLARR
jgi:acyl-CoA synthetase (AMP-forming)/AMP-acid ligase II